MMVDVVSGDEMFLCSYCVAIMLLKAFDYAMMVDVVSCDEMFFM